MLLRIIRGLGWVILICTILFHLFQAWFWGNWDQDNTGYSVGVLATFIKFSPYFIAFYVVACGMVFGPGLVKHIRRRLRGH